MELDDENRIDNLSSSAVVAKVEDAESLELSNTISVMRVQVPFTAIISSSLEIHRDSGNAISRRLCISGTTARMLPAASRPGSFFPANGVPIDRVLSTA